MRRTLALVLLAGTIAGASILPTLALSQEESETDEARLSLTTPGLPTTGRISTPPSGASAEVKRAWLASKIEESIASQSALAGSRIGIAVADVTTGDVVYEREADAKYNTASNTKLVTAAAALALLGPDFSFSTTVSAKPPSVDGTVTGDIYIRSKADPYLTTENLQQLAADVARAKVKRITGGVVVDGSYFDDVTMPPHFDEQPDEQAGFRAPVSATSLNFNNVSIVVAPASSTLLPALVAIDPPNGYVSVTGFVQTVKRGRTRLRIQSKPTAGHLTFDVRGQLRIEAKPRKIRQRVVDPATYLGLTFKNMLAQEGVTVAKSRILSQTTPADLTVLAMHGGPDVADAIRALGKYSNNYVAEMLLKVMGAESINGSRPATWTDGTKAVKDFLKERVGIDPNTYRYDNGSGLFDSNEFSPRQLVQVLLFGWRDFRTHADLLASLSIGGADGTLSQRMVGTAAERQIRAKTGTLETVSSLSGYAAVDTRRTLAFSVLVNDIPKWKTGDARALQDDVATYLLGYLQAP